MLKREEEAHQRRIAKQAISTAESANRIQQLLKEVQVVSEEVEREQRASESGIERGNGDVALTQKDLRNIKLWLKEGKMNKQ